MGSKTGYKVAEGQLVQNVITKGFSHKEFTVNIAPTRITTITGGIPAGTKVIVLHNDCGVDLRYGGADVVWEAAATNLVALRGIVFKFGTSMSIGVAEADELYFAADANGRKIVALFGV